MDPGSKLTSKEVEALVRAALEQNAQANSSSADWVESLARRLELSEADLLHAGMRFEADREATRRWRLGIVVALAAAAGSLAIGLHTFPLEVEPVLSSVEDVLAECSMEPHGKMDCVSHAAAERGDAAVCTVLEAENPRSQCLRFFARATRDIDSCLALSGPDQAVCAHEAAAVLGAPEMCDRISDMSIRQRCRAELGMNRSFEDLDDDIERCDEVALDDGRVSCFYGIIRRLSRAAQCRDLPRTPERLECLRALAATVTDPWAFCASAGPDDEQACLQAMFDAPSQALSVPERIRLCDLRRTEQCRRHLARETWDTRACPPKADDCHLEVAITTLRESNCAGIEDPGRRNACVALLSIDRGQPKRCSTIDRTRFGPLRRACETGGLEARAEIMDQFGR